MDYQTFSNALEELKEHLYCSQDFEYTEMLTKAKNNERLRNFCVLYSLKNPGTFNTFRKLANEDRDVYQMLLDLHVALVAPMDPSLRSFTRMLRYLPFYVKTDKELNKKSLQVTEESKQISKLLRTMDRSNKRQRKPNNEDIQRYIKDRSDSITLSKV